MSRVDTMERSLIAIGTSPYDHGLADRNFRDFKEVSALLRYQEEWPAALNLPMHLRPHDDI
ncbi:MAG: hypothetical protein ACLUN9_16755 [Enterocloster aldenensis]